MDTLCVQNGILDSFGHLARINVFQNEYCCRNDSHHGVTHCGCLGAAMQGIGHFLNHWFLKDILHVSASIRGRK